MSKKLEPIKELEKIQSELNNEFLSDQEIDDNLRRIEELRLEINEPIQDITIKTKKEIAQSKIHDILYKTSLSIKQPKETKTRERFRLQITKARKTIRQYILFMVGIYIGHLVLTNFLNINGSFLDMVISMFLAIAILGMLIYIGFQIKLGRKLLEEQDN